MEKKQYLLSTAYFPPVHYFSLLSEANQVLIEKEENYLKQTYRNRCIILSANGPLILSVPVLTGTNHKVKIKDIKIDYSKRWQQLHVRGLSAAYRSSPFFEYYFSQIEKVILSNHKFLISLNEEALNIIAEFIRLPLENMKYTTLFEPADTLQNDFRFCISPKKEIPGLFTFKEYVQVFGNRSGFVPGLSILDLLFNLGPDSSDYIRSVGHIR